MMLRHGGCSAGLLTLAWLMASCGGGETAVPQAPISTTPAPPSSAPPVSRSGVASPTWDADGDSFGVDRTTWPKTVKAAEPIIKRMPTTFAGHRADSFFEPATSDHDGGQGASAGVLYGADTGWSIAQAYVTTDTADGQPETMTASDLMGAHFLMGYSCAKGSYRGTAKPAEGGLGPAPTDRQSGPVWFSCRIDGAEGDENHTGHAVGWLSGETAWQVLAADARTVRSLVTHLHQATS